MTRNGLASAVRTAKRLLVARDGPLTRELLQRPGKFGLGVVPERLVPDDTTTIVCGFCATGCGLDVHLKENRAINLSPATSYPVNLGMACPKGWEALRPLESSARATTPMLRRDGRLVPVSWPEALGEMARRFGDIQARHGRGAVAWLGTGQIATEELALLGAVSKFGLGMLHGDGNTRQCMATAATAYKQAFGFDAPPYTYSDLELSDVIVLIGSNLCITHPILWERICRNRRSPRVVVIDPRATETAQAATDHFPIRPKSDLVLLYAIANELLRRAAVDRAFIAAHTEGFEQFVEAIRPYTKEAVVSSTGLSVEQIDRLVDLIGEGGRVSFWWTMGVNQSHQGVRTAQAIIALALMTGNIGKPGTGANSITGQCNAMGSRLFSNTTNLFGGREFTNAEHRAEVATILDIDVASIPDQNSFAYDQIIDAIEAGTIRGLWVVATNPAHSWIDQNRLAAVLCNLDCLVVQDMYVDTETAARADILLPAAGWGEKNGTFINSERRIGLIKKVAEAPGQALADFHIFHLVAEAFGCHELFERWQTPEAVFGLIQELSRGRPCDITGIAGYEHLDKSGGIQWPYPEHCNDQTAERRLFENGRFFAPNGRAKFVAETPRDAPELPSPEYPFVLLTGRGSSAQWHTLSRTKRSKILGKLAPAEAYVEISPQDAKRLGVMTGAWVELESKRGKAFAHAFVTPAVKLGELFVPMHYATVNRLTFPVFDPYSRQPSYKAGAVRIHAVSAALADGCADVSETS